MRALDVMDSLTGFDEIAIRKVTGQDLDEMSSSTLARAMAAMHMSRTEENLSLPFAWEKVKAMTRSELTDWYADQEEDEEEVFEDEPVTEAGKDDSGSESPQSS